MKIGGPRLFHRSILLVAACILAVVLTACTGRGGGQLPPGGGFTGAASFGFSFSCEDKGGINPQTGKLHIQLSYTEHGTNVTNVLSSGFSIHGTVDKVDPVLESMVCSGQDPPPDPPGNNVLTFLGRYRLTSSAPAGFPSSCPTQETSTSPLCRFEVTVQDNDKNRAPSPGDSFSIKLSSSPNQDCVSDPLGCSNLDPSAPVVYARAGILSSGNLTVD
jgi:hypothetical protein